MFPYKETIIITDECMKCLCRYDKYYWTAAVLNNVKISELYQLPFDVKGMHRSKFDRYLDVHNQRSNQYLKTIMKFGQGTRKLNESADESFQSNYFVLYMREKQSQETFVPVYFLL